MPHKKLPAEEMPTLVLEKLRSWGSCIKKLRLRQNMRAEDLCLRMRISYPTLRRVERGDPGAGIGLYLNALMILGALDIAAPPLPSYIAELPESKQRVRPHRPAEDDDDF
ncbi:XRE family transcriptional regulator [Oxalobacteraceae bacterium CAVE-383]|nr:XRE family transcriptional regulator [Oxalobacteraceae bacterium CAVE-383]